VTLTVATVYDGEGRPLEKTLALQGVVYSVDVWVYDAEGRLLSTTTGPEYERETTSYTYDSDGRIQTVMQPSSLFVGESDLETYVYNDEGHLDYVEVDFFANGGVDYTEFMVYDSSDRRVESFSVLPVGDTFFRRRWVYDGPGDLAYVYVIDDGDDGTDDWWEHFVYVDPDHIGLHEVDHDVDGVIDRRTETTYTADLEVLTRDYLWIDSFGESFTEERYVFGTYPRYVELNRTNYDGTSSSSPVRSVYSEQGTWTCR
jgi:YD repeat-containing protein